MRYIASSPNGASGQTTSHLRSTGHQLLQTRFGSLDILGAIGKGRQYEDLLPRSSRLRLDDNAPIPVLGLAAQIEIKEEVNAPKDAAILPLLRRTLEES
jgi:hypothetical protein